MPRNTDHQGASREEFERFERERPIMLRALATRLEAWRSCASKECRRGKACTGPDGGACIGHFMRTMLGEEERATFHEALRLRQAGVGAGAAWEEAGRKVGRHRRKIEAIDGMTGEAGAGADQAGST